MKLIICVIGLLFVVNGCSTVFDTNPLTNEEQLEREKSWDLPVENPWFWNNMKEK
jgi:hypothetical protein